MNWPAPLSKNSIPYIKGVFMIKLFVLIFLIPVLCFAMDKLSETEKKEIEKLKTSISENINSGFQKSLKQQETKNNALIEKIFNCQKNTYLAQLEMNKAKSDADRKTLEAKVKIVGKCSIQIQKESMEANLKELESAIVETKKNIAKMKKEQRP